jgi:hypothetical protein
MAIRIVEACIAIVLAVPGGVASAAGTDSTSSMNPAAIAARVSEAFRHTEPLPRELLADKIEVRHVPAMAVDPEVIDKAKLGVDDQAALKKAMRDFHMDVVSVESDPHGFTVKLVLAGTPASGKQYSSEMSLHFVVKHGVITAFVATQDPGERRMLEEIEREGGFRASQPE